jgi:hypothetical protein
VLLQKRKLTLKDTVDVCRSTDATQQKLKTLNANEEENVHKVKAKAYKKESKSQRPKYKKSHCEIKPLMCKFCVQKHVMNVTVSSLGWHTEIVLYVCAIIK